MSKQKLSALLDTANPTEQAERVEALIAKVQELTAQRPVSLLVHYDPLTRRIEVLPTGADRLQYQTVESILSAAVSYIRQQERRAVSELLETKNAGTE